MNFPDLVAKRRMVRNFTAEPVDPQAIERILKPCAPWPSAGYTQGQDFVVVTRQDLKDGIAELCEEKKLRRGRL